MYVERTRLDLALQYSFEARDKVDLGAVCIFENARVKQYLIWFAEIELDFILVHELPIGLCAFELHCEVRRWPRGGGTVGGMRGEVRSQVAQIL